MTTSDTNPLLDFSGLPRFSQIRPEHVAPALEALLAEARAGRERLLSGNSTPTWATLVQPLEDMNERIQRMWSPAGHLNAVMNSEALRKEYDACLPRLSAYSTEVAQDERLYAAYKKIAASDEYQAFDSAQKKIIDNTLRDFRLAGAELNGDDKKRFAEIQQKLAQLGSSFQNNVLDATQAWHLHLTEDNQLAGLPEFARDMGAQAAKEKELDGWCFTLDGPSYLAFMTYADDRDLRQQLYQAYVCRASDQGPNAGKWDNGPVIDEMLALRQEAAHLLGFDNYAEYSLATKMARDVSQVLGFLQDLAGRSRPTASQEFTELSAFARDHDGTGTLSAWDIAYYSEKLREQRYAFSREELRPYFPESQVLPGMFEVIHRLYGMTVEPLTDVEIWHPDVKVYEIRQSDGIVRGRFYLDLYARSGKRGGAWMDDCVSRKRERDTVQTPTAYLVCNFSAPVGNKPALFNHDEVITLFHEFGHGLHHMLTQVDYVSVSGINGVAWDAVELPSQFMENWCWQREALDVIARHYETGKPIPDDLLDKMHAAKNFQSAMQMVRQLEFALFDMRLHSEHDPQGDRSVQQLLDEVRAEVAVVPTPAFSRFQNGFGHIFAGGYAAGYYSYKWAEVLSADAFSKFEEQGIFNRKTGTEFLHSVLEQGGSRDPLELFIEFRGREPDVEALLRHSGLAA
ncbi:MAG: oligopeptidase A [Acidithiobacillales bacterium SG8_45]|jgi:oligopeptidase A|nr:MAG: oligopeptidase A [Acidithiobacillales bacterium SG8_45]